MVTESGRCLAIDRQNWRDLARQDSQTPQLVEGAMITSSPVSSITPAPSQPRIIGSGIFTPGMPLRTQRSMWFIATDLTLTSVCSG